MQRRPVCLIILASIGAIAVVGVLVVAGLTWAVFGGGYRLDAPETSSQAKAVATPIAVPTRRPSPEPPFPMPTLVVAKELELKATTTTDWMGNLMLIGVVSNRSDQMASNPEFTGIFMQDGIIVGEETATGALGMSLEAGEWTPFALRFPDAQWDSWRLTVEESRYSSTGYTTSGLEVESDELLPNGTLRCVVRNTQSVPVTDLWGVAAAYDDEGNVVAVEWNFPETRSLQPGEAAVLSIPGGWQSWSGDINQAETYAIRVRGTIE